MVSARYDARFECLQGYGKKEQRESLFTQGEKVLTWWRKPIHQTLDMIVMCVFYLLIVPWLWSVSLFNTNDMLLLTDDCPNDHIGMQSKCSILGSDGKIPCKVEHSAIWCYLLEEEAELKRHFFKKHMYGCKFCRIPLAPWCHPPGSVNRGKTNQWK